MTSEGHHSAHWQSVYATKAPNAVSWYRDHLDVSLRLLERASLAPDSRVIDVGGGASTLVDDLLDRGIGSIAVLDWAPAALDVARSRLGERGGRVEWLIGDVTKIALPEHGYTHWHDRAVLHFLTDEGDARAYAAQAAHAVAPGGWAVIGGFAPDGPERCSGGCRSHGDPLRTWRRCWHRRSCWSIPGMSCIERRRAASSRSSTRCFGAMESERFGRYVDVGAAT